MKSWWLIPILALGACKEQAQSYLDPVALTAEAVGHFCQMGILEHEGPKAQVHLEGLPGAPLFFSQVRDAVAYLRLPEQTHVILAVYVSDVGTENADWSAPERMDWIKLDDAQLVVGSSREGGMGLPELVPFANAEDAAAFTAVWGGQVLSVDDVPDSAVLAPPASPSDGGDDEEFERRLQALSASREG